MVDTLPGNFGDVDQAFEILIKAYERSEICDSCDLTFDVVADDVFGEHGFLTGFPNGFLGSNDLLFALMGVEDLHFEGFTDEALEFLKNLHLFAARDTWIVFRGKL